MAKKSPKAETKKNGSKKNKSAKKKFGKQKIDVCESAKVEAGSAPEMATVAQTINEQPKASLKATAEKADSANADVGKHLTAANNVSQVQKTGVAAVGTVAKKPLQASEQIKQPALSLPAEKGFQDASFFLSFAAGIAVLLGLAAVFLPSGQAAVNAMSGLGNVQVPLRTAQWVLLLDTLLPLFYGSGMVLLVFALRNRENKQLVRHTIFVILFAIAADFAENAVVFQSMTRAVSTNAMQWPISVVKFGLLAWAGILAATMFDPRRTFGRVLRLLLQFAMPLMIALSITGIGGMTMRMVASASLPVLLILLSVYASSEATEIQGR